MEKFDVNNKKDIEELFNDCKKAQQLSYSPYSKTKVGACIWTKDHKKIYGANIENAAYGDCICAERTAMFSSHLQGNKKEDQIVLGVIAEFKGYAYPCGSCRQVMSELLPLDCQVIMFNEQGGFIHLPVKDIMPGLFTSKDLKNI